MKRARSACYQRLDYKLLHTTSEKVEKRESTGVLRPVSEPGTTMSDSETANDGDKLLQMSDNQLNQLLIKETTLSYDIKDYIEENPVDCLHDSVNDLDVAIRRVEDFRTTYRGKHVELCTIMGEQYDVKSGKLNQNMMGTIKNYILQAKRIRKMIRESEVLEKQDEKLTKGNSF